MNGLLSRLRRLLRSVIDDSRNYSCWPIDTGDPRTPDEAVQHAPNHPEPANSVEKDGSLR